MLLRRRLQASASEGRKGHEKARATEAMARVRERSRWFKPRLTRWGVEPHRLRGRSQRRDTGRRPACRCVRMLTQIIISSKECARLSWVSPPHTHLTLNKSTSRARKRGHFGAGLVLWLQELEDSEAFVNAMMRRPVEYATRKNFYSDLP